MEVVPGVHHIGFIYGGCYLIAGEKLTLIDTGSQYTARRVLRAIERLGRSPRELELILLTHDHFDHAGGAAFIKRKTGARVLGSAVEAVPGKSGRLSLWPGILYKSRRWRLLGRLFAASPVVMDGALRDGEVLPVHGGIRVISTPGHAPGHFSFYLEKQKVLFAGDLIINNGDRLSRPFPFRGTSPELVDSSLKKLSGLEVRALCCSHGRPVAGDLTSALQRLIDTPAPAVSFGQFLVHMVGLPFRSRKR